MTIIKKLLIIRHPKAKKYEHGESMDLLLQGEVQKLREDPGEYLKETFVIPQEVTPEQARFNHSERLRTFQACQAIAIGAFGLQYIPHDEIPGKTPDIIEVDNLPIFGYQGIRFSLDNGLSYRTPSINSRIHKEQGPVAVLKYEMRNPYLDQHEECKINPFLSKMIMAESAASKAVKRLLAQPENMLEVLCSHSCQVEPAAMSLVVPDIRKMISQKGYVEPEVLDKIGGAFMERDYAEVTFCFDGAGKIGQAVYERRVGSGTSAVTCARQELDIQSILRNADK